MWEMRVHLSSNNLQSAQWKMNWLDMPSTNCPAWTTWKVSSTWIRLHAALFLFSHQMKLLLDVDWEMRVQPSSHRFQSARWKMKWPEMRSKTFLAKRRGKQEKKRKKERKLSFSGETRTRDFRLCLHKMPATLQYTSTGN